MVKNLIKYLLLMAVIFGTFSCTNSEFKINEIDKELNSSLITLKGLDSRLFSSKEKLQYFEISGYNKLKPIDLKKKLTNFIIKNYSLNEILKADEFTFMFYKKSPFVDYRKYIYEAARDTERGTIDEYKDNLVAQVWFTKSTEGKSICHAAIYDNNVQLLNETDTASIKATSPKNVSTSAVKPFATLEGNNCLIINGKKDKVPFRNCYNVDFIRINSATDKKLALTFISGKNAMDIDFFPADNDWIAKEVTSFGPTSDTSKGIKTKLEVSLKKFNFSTVSESFFSE